MSPGEEPSWDSLPDHLKTSKLAHAICPQGAQAAEHDLEEVLFFGRYAFFGFSRAELGAYLWKKFGEQLNGMSDAEVLAWMKHMNFRDHAAFDEMGDDETVQFIRQTSAALDGYAVRYVHSHDFPAACDQNGIVPGSTIEEKITQARRLFRENTELVSILPSLLEEEKD